LPGGILPDQDFERQVDADGLDRLHQRRAALGVAEDQKIGRVQGQTCCGGAGRMVDMCEYGKAFAFNFGFEPIHRFHRPVTAAYGYQPVRGHDARSPCRQSLLSTR
jgi:hypothetical protein